MSSFPDVARFAVALLAVGACSAEAETDRSSEPLVPADVEATFDQARDCRFSHDHELTWIRVLADAAAFTPYTTWSSPYPEGATLVKLEYQDAACTTLQGMTAMRKRAHGSAPERGDWQWQKLDAERRVVPLPGGSERCVDCHREHCSPPWGFDLGCGENLPF